MSGCTYEHCDEADLHPPGEDICECECRNCLGANMTTFAERWRLEEAFANVLEHRAKVAARLEERLRDDMAMHAMAALLRQGHNVRSTVALHAYEYADALLKERGDERRAAALDALKAIRFGLKNLAAFGPDEPLKDFVAAAREYHEEWLQRVEELLR